MAQPYIGEIRLFAGNFAPVGWAFCDGQLVSISENESLFILIGTTYGGDGESTFALPDLRGRVPVHQNDINHFLGETAGVETVTLTASQIPAHSHVLIASNNAATARTPAGNVFARSAGDAYTGTFDPVALSPQSVTSTGGSQPHENMQPYLCVSYIISLYGIFPSET